MVRRPILTIPDMPGEQAYALYMHMERRENVDVFEALKRRRAVRDFKAESIPDELLRKLV